ncbi:MAG TPA: efflux RND transporter periplasmic adaptor subunit [Candidatus Acidoferrales bacterium]|jgi:RND family efflux transporter MFP subunit|nr:efflux RND transporter periplasmic adaptor subunit [Candidatus Acidoferrales bacterium]
MTTIQFLAEWALRSSILILSGALLLRALRVKDPAVGLAAWTAMLCASLAIPALTAALPKVPLTLLRGASGRVEVPVAVGRGSDRSRARKQAVYHAALPPVRAISPADVAVERRGTGVSGRFDWARAAVTVYVMVALALLLRLCVGFAMSLLLLRGSHITGRATEGIEIRQSGRVAAPVTLGIARPAIVLPQDWSQWDSAKLDAVLAHERSHILRHDPAVQLLSAIHRVLLWHSPLSWFLHRRIVRVAEEASDDAAVTATRDRAAYAQVLLDFMQGQKGARLRGPNWQGVPMARYDRADQRIHRILDATALSHGITRWSVAAILALGSPLAYVVAAAHPQSPPHAPAAAAPAAVIQATAEKQPAVDALAVKPSGRNSRVVSGGALPGGRLMAAQIVAQSPDAVRQKLEPDYLAGLGRVAAYTVTVTPRVDGQLMSVSFKEGDLVQAGQVLASIDPRPYQLRLIQAEGPLARDQAQLADVRRNQNTMSKQQFDNMVAQVEASIKADQANIDSAKLQLTYTQIAAPITGVAGLLMVDPGNMVHAADATGIVIINQLQPIAVLFTIPQDSLPQVLARLREGASLPVEAWNRNNNAKLATGRLTAVDNQIDPATGTARLKAVFDNKDGALFPNQFVNVRMPGNTK